MSENFWYDFGNEAVPLRCGCFPSFLQEPVVSWGKLNAVQMRCAAVGPNRSAVDFFSEEFKLRFDCSP